MYTLNYILEKTQKFLILLNGYYLFVGLVAGRQGPQVVESEISLLTHTLIL